MKKIWIIAGVIGILALIAGGVGLAYAQDSVLSGPGSDVAPGSMGPGAGMASDGVMADLARRGGPPPDAPWAGDEMGPMHELMTAELAAALGLTPDEFQARIANGESFMQIGLELGFGWEELRELMYQAHERARARAVEEGLIDPEQYEWMHMHRQRASFDGEAPPQPGPYGDPESCPGGGTGPHGPAGRGRNGG